MVATVPSSQWTVSDDLLSDVTALGELGVAIRPALDRYIDNFNRVQYTLQAAASNLSSAFPLFLAGNSKVGEVRKNTSELLWKPRNDNIASIKNMLQQALAIQKSQKNVDAPLGRILTNAIDNGMNCLSDLGLYGSQQLLMRCATIAIAAEEVNMDKLVFNYNSC